MANRADTYNSGVRISPQFSSISSATAAGTGDATQVTGATVDRQGFGSAKVCITYTTALTAAKTLAVAVSRQDSDDGSTWEDAEVVAASTVLATGAGTVTGTYCLNDSYETAARYVRYLVTPDLSHTGTDTATLACTVILGGAYNGTELPLE